MSKNIWRIVILTITKTLELYGYSYVGEVCNPYNKISQIQSRDYFITVTTAAHELAHNLGANHDGEGNAVACRADDYFLMSPYDPLVRKTPGYSRNPWIFSNCSVDVFKDELKHKPCLNNVGIIYNQMEWNEFTNELPGQVYSLNKQCELYNGHGSYFCGYYWIPPSRRKFETNACLDVIKYGLVSGDNVMGAFLPVHLVYYLRRDETPDVCLSMKCKDPFTHQCLPKRFSAFRGTDCGQNRWCKEGLCVSKALK